MKGQAGGLGCLIPFALPLRGLARQRGPRLGHCEALGSSFHLALPLGEASHDKLQSLVFRFFALPTAPCKELLVLVPASVPLPCLFKEGGLKAASPPCGIPSSRWSVNNQKMVWCYS